MAAIAWPDEKPGAGLPRILAAGKMLKRSTVSGPRMRLKLTSSFSGTMAPVSERTKTWRRSSGFSRKSASDDRLTR